MGQIGQPKFVLALNADDEAVKKRWSAANDDAEVDEEKAAEFKQAGEDAAARTEAFKAAFPRLVSEVDTSSSLESTLKMLSAKFQPQVLLVNNHQKIDVDTISSNVSLKHNLLYLSVPDLIKQHIEDKSEWGKKLLASRNLDILNLTDDDDDYENYINQPVVYDMQTVLQMLKETILEKRQDQKYVLVEGFCKNQEALTEQQRFERRFMDELFQIEKYIGTVRAVIGMGYVYEPESINEEDLKYIEFEQKQEQAPQADPAAEAEQPAEGEEGQPPAKKWKAEDYKWTESNRKSLNFPQVFAAAKGRGQT